MGLETATYIEDLNDANPLGTDNVNQGDDHIRLIKEVLQNQFPNLGQAAMNLQASSLNAMIGMVAAFAAAPGGGWLVCDGSAVSRTTYSALFAIISDDYGSGDGSTTFNLPDYRGQFLRGVDDGAGTDPDAGTRTDRGDGTTGDVVGTKQSDQNASHQHDSAGGHQHTGNTGFVLTSGSGDGFQTTGSGSSPFNVDTTVAGAHQHPASGGDEARPTNVGVLYYILAQ